MRDRSFRREQHDRAKRRARRTWRLMDAQDGSDTGRADDPRYVGRRANTRTLSTQEDRSYRGAHKRAVAALNASEQIAAA